MFDLFETLCNQQKMIAELMKKGMTYDQSIRKVYGDDAIDDARKLIDEVEFPPEYKKIVGVIADDSFSEIAPNIDTPKQNS